MVHSFSGQLPGSTDQYTFLTECMRSACESFHDLSLPEDVDWRQTYLSKRALADAIAILDSQRVAFVDDNIRYLSAYVMPLQLATGGNAHFVLSDSRPLSEVVAQLIECKPDIVLVDYFLCPGSRTTAGITGSAYTGADVVRALRSLETEEDPMLIIGFSADGMFEEFAAAGADAAACKLDPVEPEIVERLGWVPTEEAIRTVAQLVSTLRGPARAMPPSNIAQDATAKRV